MPFWPRAAAFSTLILVSTLPSAPQAQSSHDIVVAPHTLAELRAWDDHIDGMIANHELRLRQVREDTVLPGRSHERLDQYYKGVRVFGADVTRQTSNGISESLFGQLYSVIDVDTTPAISEAGALSAIRAETSEDVVAADPAEVVILPTAGDFALAYRVRITSESIAADYFVDAHTGAVLLHLSNIHTAAAVGTGLGVLGDLKKLSDDSIASGFLARDLLRPPVIRTYDMRGDLTRVKAFLNRTVTLGDSDLASTTSTNSWSDPAIVDGHAHAGMVYDFYFKRFGRRGLDNNNLPLISVVHPVLRVNVFTASSADLGTFYLNAFWVTGLNVMVYGDGLPPGIVFSATRQSWNYTSGALDIIGHELTHGVTQFTSSLINQNESGALNESFSDMMGTSAEFFYRSTATNGPRPDYLMGADVITGPLNGLRSLSTPSLFGDPDHYSRRFVGASDAGGIHTNCGISNNAFYLAIEGGANRTSGLSVQGVGSGNREQIEKVFYRAFAFLLPANATFTLARAATIQSARDLYGEGSPVERAVLQAWTAVGVN